MDPEQNKAARAVRASERRARMTGELVELGTPKQPPYASSSPDERLAAAVRLIEYHLELRGGYQALPRSEWPGETFTLGSVVG